MGECKLKVFPKFHSNRFEAEKSYDAKFGIDYRGCQALMSATNGIKICNSTATNR